MKKTLLKAAVIILAAISLNSCLAGKYMCNYALKPTPHGVDDIERTRHKADSLKSGSTLWYDTLKEQGLLKDTVITGYNDYKVHAAYVPAARPAQAKGTAIVVHGYTDNHFVFLYLVRMYRDEFNYNVLFPDLQYHGYSEGAAAQMGWLDRFDVEKWCEVAHGIFKDDFQVVHGVSMGAATVMMMSGDELPEYVRAFVEDCGYSSAWDQFATNLKQSFHLPPFPILTSASIVCKNRYGWSFKEASSVKQLAKSDRPMLFIHGDADDFVPFSHLQKNYDAKVKGYKEMWVAEGAVHANSYAKHPEEYTRRVDAFLQKVHSMIKDGTYPEGK
ncbi:MAG: alpha/beta hydrolase [Bacteroidales bacterium]|nr:alpha/beta hydrolase [Bacteroidales bacterium]MBP5374571.1 alpha/beta hydrolase [Bacteroidales bacterium]